MPSQDREREVIVVGAGFAGALAALTLARRGFGVTAVDIHRSYGSDFRCEKFSPEQAALLAELDAVAPLGAAGPEALVQQGLRYDRMVNALRGAWPERVRFQRGRVRAIEPGEELQRVVLTSGDALQARLVVLATGPGERLRRSLGIEKRLLRERHSLCIGFSLAAPDERPFGFTSLVRHGGRPGEGMGFASLFPMDGAMRVNLFSYREPSGCWARNFRFNPLISLIGDFPDLRPLIGEATVLGPAEFGVTDLYETSGWVMPGVVVIGDAFASSCPATGMGMTRILTDVRQLALVHAPAWFETPGMGAAKIAAFYADPVKRAVDATSLRRAQTGRSAAVETSLRWLAYRRLSQLRRSLRGPPTRRAAA